MARKADHNSSKRRYARFPGGPLDHALIDTNVESGPFSPCYLGMIFQVAYGGCGLLLLTHHGLGEQLTQGSRCRVRFGQLDPILSEVVWVKELDKDAVKMGFKFLEPMSQMSDPV